MELDRTLIVAPHPDDDVIGAGGLIQRVLAARGDLHVVFVTDGENNPWPQRLMQKRWTITDDDRAEWGRMRRLEALCSLARLGVGSSATTFLALPDQKLTQLVRFGNKQLLTSLRSVIEAFQPTMIVTPSTLDLHSDHRAVSWATHLAAADSPIMTYVVHGNGPESRLACRFELTEAEQQRKRQAIECHRSQLLLSRDRFLSYAQPLESFFTAEFDLLAAQSLSRNPLATLRHALRVVFGNYPAVEPSGVQTTADVQDSPGDVPGVL